MNTSKSRSRLWQRLAQLVEEWESTRELTRYFDYINMIIDIADIELLFAVWKWSLELGRVGAVFRAQIENSVSAIAQKNALPKPESFRELIYLYDESLFTCEDDIDECLILYTLEGNLKRVKQSVARGADDWPRGLEAAARVGSFELVDFYLQKIKEDSLWPERKMEEYKHESDIYIVILLI
jgi:hypothetical protein